MKSMITLSQTELENVLFNTFANNLNNHYILNQQNPDCFEPYSPPRTKTTFEHRIDADGKLEISMIVEPATDEVAE